MSADGKRATVLCNNINCWKAKDLLFIKKQWENKQKEEDEYLNKMSHCSVICHAETVVVLM